MSRSVPEWRGRTDDVKVPARVRLRIVKRQHFKCAECGRTFDEKLKPEFDHIVPLILGGEHREKNLQALCERDHAKKTRGDVAARAKVDKVIKNRLGIRLPRWRIVPGSKKSRWKKKLDGTVIDRRTGKPVKRR